MPAARDFVNDAYAHCKFIAYTEDAMALFEATGLSRVMDEGFVNLGPGGESVSAYLTRCRQLRHWDRELAPARA
jgi:catalase